MQLFSVAISCGNKMNFSLYVKVSGFCSDSHILYAYTTTSNLQYPLHYDILLQ